MPLDPISPGRRGRSRYDAVASCRQQLRFLAVPHRPSSNRPSVLCANPIDPPLEMYLMQRGGLSVWVSPCAKSNSDLRQPSMSAASTLQNYFRPVEFRFLNHRLDRRSTCTLGTVKCFICMAQKRMTCNWSGGGLREGEGGNIRSLPQLRMLRRGLTSWNQGTKCGAGRGNRTLVGSLGSYCSTIKLYPLWCDPMRTKSSAE